MSSATHPWTDLAVAELNNHNGALPASELVSLIARRYPGQIAFANSFGLEDVVLQHLLLPWQEAVETFVLDTGRLPGETFELIERWRAGYGLACTILSPRAEVLEPFVAAHGPNAFYTSPELRKECCAKRKLEPLQRALAGKPVWLTGLRREQSPARSEVPLFCRDAAGRLKVSPLAAWSLSEVWSYIRKHNIPYNVLHDRGYPSLGCAPCTRAVAPGEDARAGRWWWEHESKRECGLHVRPEVADGVH